MGILMLKKIRSCKNFGGPVKLGFSMWLPVLRSGKGPKVFPMSGKMFNSEYFLIKFAKYFILKACSLWFVI